MSETSIYLDPLNQAVADQSATQPPLQDLTVEQFRAFFAKLQQHDPIPGVTRTKFTVPFEDGVEVFIFRPDGAKGDLPVIFYFHGGGWIGGESVNRNI
jgi:acetyl esterase/lipase